MSRIGVKPIPVASGVEITVADGMMRVKGPKATLEQAQPQFTTIEIESGQAVVKRDGEHKAAKASHGLTRSLLANMVTGVTEGFTKILEVVGVGYRVEVSGKSITLHVGYSHPVTMETPDGLEVRADGTTKLVVSGPDKQRVGQFAADIRKVRPPEPYKGKGIRYSDEQVRRKVGKSQAGG